MILQYLVGATSRGRYSLTYSLFPQIFMGYLPYPGTADAGIKCLIIFVCFTLSRVPFLYSKLISYVVPSDLSGAR